MVVAATAPGPQPLLQHCWRLPVGRWITLRSLMLACAAHLSDSMHDGCRTLRLMAVPCSTVSRCCSSHSTSSHWGWRARNTAAHAIMCVLVSVPANMRNITSLATLSATAALQQDQVCKQELPQKLETCRSRNDVGPWTHHTCHYFALLLERADNTSPAHQWLHTKRVQLMSSSTSPARQC
jgi:hypothetical protein